MSTYRLFRLRVSAIKIVLIGVFVVVLVLAGTRLTNAASPIVVGVAPAAQNAIELVGRIDQTGLSFVSYGYLSYVAGVPANQVFTNLLDHSEGTARFTFVSKATLTARSILDGIFVLNAAGTTTIYLNDKPSANFKDPKSFESGTVIAVGNERWQNIVNVQAPDTAIATGIGEWTETTATAFKLNGQDYILGSASQLLRFTYTGEGKRTDKNAPNSTFAVAGFATTGGN